MEGDWNELLQRIDMSSYPKQLRRLRSEFHDSIGAASDIGNDFHDALIKKAVQMAERELRWEARGCRNAVNYAFLLFGSGGRREQSWSSDQDNGIVFEPADGACREQAKACIAELADTVSGNLEGIGYPPCNGNVLGRNPYWRRSAGEWEAAFMEWAELGSFETVRHLLIAADARIIHGSCKLADRFTLAHASAVRKRQAFILPRMLDNTLRHKVLMGIFGNLLTEPYGTETGSIDIKYGAYIPMVNCVRLLAIREGLAESSTLGRIGALRRCGAVSSATAEAWEAAFRSVLAIRSMIPTRIDDNGFYVNSGKLPAHLLSKEVRKQLKKALRIGAEMQKSVKRSFQSEVCP